jgi:hypothetical protein
VVHRRRFARLRERIGFIDKKDYGSARPACPAL